MKNEERRIKLGRVNLDQVRVDHRWQRPLDKRWVDTMVADFDPYGVGVISVASAGDGWFDLLDGQHRVEALRAQGVRQTLAVIYDGLEDWGKARIFVRHNTKKNVRAFYIHRALLEANDPEAVGLDEAVRSVGTLRIADSPHDDTVRCITTLKLIYRQSTPPGDLLVRTLRAIYGAWGGLPDAYESSIIRGVAEYLKAHPERTEHDATVHLVGIGAPLNLIGRARAARGHQSMSSWEAIKLVLETLDRRGRRVRRAG